MNCPVCKEPQLVMSEKKGIEIDYCPSCRGIWLDRGELDKIIERSKEDMPEPQRANPSDNNYRQDSHYHKDSHHRPYKRKKSFLEELFD